MELLSKPNDEALLRSENAYWRNVADYNNSALQLYYYLRGVDWQKALAVHFASWQRNGVVKMETRAWDFGGYPWVGWYRDKSHPHGRLIQRYSIQHRFERARFARLVLPIPSPLEYAKRQLRQALELLTRQYSQSYEAGLATAPDKRLYSTNELKRISQELGQPALASWEVNAWLKTLLELNVTRREILAPAKAGAMLAKIDFFRLRWQDFHEAEKQVPAATPVPPLDTPAFTVIKSQAQVLSEMIAQIATDAEASANAKGFTLVGKPDNPVPPAPPQPLDTPATTEPLQPGSPALETPVPTVADLCRLPFTPADLSELLVRLKVISPAGTCLTNDLKGKAQGPRAAFTAAYRVLHRAGLLNPVVDDKTWATAFLQAYGAKLGKGAISHKLTVHGTAFTPAPLPFTEAVNTTREWVNEWQNRR